MSANDMLLASQPSKKRSKIPFTLSILRRKPKEKELNDITLDFLKNPQNEKLGEEATAVEQVKEEVNLILNQETAEKVEEKEEIIPILNNAEEKVEKEIVESEEQENVSENREKEIVIAIANEDQEKSQKSSHKRSSKNNETNSKKSTKKTDKQKKGSSNSNALEQKLSNGLQSKKKSEKVEDADPEEKGLEEVFKRMDFETVKNCRLVCSKWNKVISLKIFPSKTVACIDGSKEPQSSYNPFKWFFSTPKAPPLENFVNFFCNSNGMKWNILRLRNIKSSQLESFFAKTQYKAKFRQAVSEIKIVRFIGCNMTLKWLLDLLSYFTDLDEIYHINSVYEDEKENSSTSSFEWCPAIPSSSSKKKSEKQQWPPDMTYAQKYKFPVFRILCIHSKIEGTLKNADELIMIFKDTTVFNQLDEIEIVFGSEMASADSHNWTKIFASIWLLISRHDESLEKLRLHFANTNVFPFEFFVNFTRFFSLTMLKSNPICITYFDIDFKFIWLSQYFRDVWITIIKKMNHLQYLSLRTIMFDLKWAHLLDELEEVVKNRDFEFTIEVCDVPIENADGSNVQMTQVLEKQAYQKSLREVIVGIFTDKCFELDQVFPVRSQSLTFSKVVRFQVDFSKKNLQPQFTCYNIDNIARMFPNLNDLRIVDGEWNIGFVKKYIPWSKKYWTKTTSAPFINEHLQIIFKQLPKLKILILKLDLSKITDFGMTGFIEDDAKIVKDVNENKEINPEDLRTGYSFSNLKDLERISLIGLDSSISDFSALHGFDSLKKLEYLRLSGQTKMTSVGKEFLRKKFESPECWVRLEL